MKFQKNELAVVTIEDMGSDGFGIGKVDGFALFVKDAVVGDMVEFGGLLGSAPVMPCHTGSAEAFAARGGRIPAPLQSLKN